MKGLSRNPLESVNPTVAAVMEQNLALIMLDVKKLSRNPLNQKSWWWAGVRPGFFLAGFFFAGMLLLRCYSTTATEIFKQ